MKLMEYLEERKVILETSLVVSQERKEFDIAFKAQQRLNEINDILKMLRDGTLSN